MLGGTLVIDNTLGTVLPATDVTISFESPTVGPFRVFELIGSIGTETVIGLNDASVGTLFLEFPTATLGSLVGYDGSPFFSEIQILSPPPQTILLFQGDSGSTLTPISTPEPSTDALMLLGAGIMLVMRRRIGQVGQGRPQAS
jgi:hypothetical protein